VLASYRGKGRLLAERDGALVSDVTSDASLTEDIRRGGLAAILDLAISLRALRLPEGTFRFYE
jgi:hypothetical protein